MAATAGMLGNATRAGDPAGWHGTAQGNHGIVSETRIKPPTEESVAKGTDLLPLTPFPKPLSQRERGLGHPHQEAWGEDHGGTIIIMAFVNRPCTTCLSPGRDHGHQG